jgi:small-conductance mechanosensitive channel
VQRRRLAPLGHGAVRQQRRQLGAPRPAAIRTASQYRAQALATGAVAGARARLQGIRRATVVAVAVTGFLLLLIAPEEAVEAQESPPLSPLPAQPLPPPQTEETPVPPNTVEDFIRATMAEAAAAVEALWFAFWDNLPRFLVALFVFGIAWAIVRLVRPALRRALYGWERVNAATALFGFAIWVVAFGIATSVLVGDIRALLGSLGLVGLALSWALQTPIESVSGWLLNSFQGYYRVGDRVAVGDIFGDVYRIDLLTTTVWEIGSPERPGFVAAEQPTGRLITFPNNEVLRGSIVNLTRDFPFVWDELSVPVANESDLGYAIDVLLGVARTVLADEMAEPARRYEAILRRAQLEFAIPSEPQVFVSLDDSWVNLTIRYLVGARERRKWKSALAKGVTQELNRPEHASRIISVYPRRQVQVIGPDGRPDEKRSDGRSQ